MTGPNLTTPEQTVNAATQQNPIPDNWLQMKTNARRRANGLQQPSLMSDATCPAPPPCQLIAHCGTRCATRAWRLPRGIQGVACFGTRSRRSEEHTSELQSLMRISYAVFC